MSGCLSLLHELTIFFPPSHFVVLQLWQKKKRVFWVDIIQTWVYEQLHDVYIIQTWVYGHYTICGVFLGVNEDTEKNCMVEVVKGTWTWCGNYYYNLVSIFMKWKLTWHILESLGVENLNGNSLWSVNAWGGEMKWVSKFFLFLEIIIICCNSITWTLFPLDPQTLCASKNTNSVTSPLASV